MSGHSKWATTKHKKAIKDAKRGNVFSKLSKLITVAVRMGGGDMESNFSLRLAVEKAKKVSMPKDKIDNAIKSGTGDNKDGAQIEEGLYEGYGPGGVAVIVKVLSDNKNRIVSDVKYIFSKNGGSMGEAGSVKWMFEQKGIVRIEVSELKEKNIDRDDFELSMMDAGAQDLDEQEGIIEIQTKMEDLKKVLDVLTEKVIEAESSSLDWIAKDLVPLPENKIPQLERLFDAFEENDDIQDYYTNAE